jgi:hypothetical protein
MFAIPGAAARANGAANGNDPAAAIELARRLRLVNMGMHLSKQVTGLSGDLKSTSKGTPAKSSLLDRSRIRTIRVNTWIRGGASAISRDKQFSCLTGITPSETRGSCRRPPSSPHDEAPFRRDPVASEGPLWMPRMTSCGSEAYARSQRTQSPSARTTRLDRCMINFRTRKP